MCRRWILLAVRRATGCQRTACVARSAVVTLTALVLGPPPHRVTAACQQGQVPAADFDGGPQAEQRQGRGGRDRGRDPSRPSVTSGPQAGQRPSGSDARCGPQTGLRAAGELAVPARQADPTRPASPATRSQAVSAAVSAVRPANVPFPVTPPRPPPDPLSVLGVTARPWLDSRRECALLDSRSAAPSVAERTPRRNRLARAHTRTHPHTHTHETQRPSVGSLRTLPPHPARPGPPTVSRSAAAATGARGALYTAAPRSFFYTAAPCLQRARCVCVLGGGGRAVWRRGCHSGLGLTMCECTLLK